MTDRTIVITGMGLVTPYGVGNESFASAYNRGENAIRDLTLFPPPCFKRWRVGEVTDFQASDILGNRGLRNFDRVTLLLLTASELLHRDMGFSELEERRKHFADEEVSIVVGTMASIKSIQDFDKETVINPGLVRPGRFPNTVFCAAASYAAIRRSIKESCLTITNDETSALYAFGYGADHLITNRVKLTIVGAAEELSDAFLMVSLKVARTRSSNMPVLTEGSQLFALELRETAAQRNALELAEVLGFSSWHCPDKRAGYHHGIEMLGKQVGHELLSEVSHIFASTRYNDEIGAFNRRDIRVIRLFNQFGYMSSMAGSMAVASALADESIKPGSVVLINTMTYSGGGACLLIRKLIHSIPSR